MPAYIEKPYQKASLTNSFIRQLYSFCGIQLIFANKTQFCELE